MVSGFAASMVCPSTDGGSKETIHYFSLNHAIKQGQFDPVTTAGKLTQYGNFGLGSSEKLGAELVLLDGIAYGIPSDGNAKKMEDNTGIAFAVAKKFVADTTFAINEMKSFSKLQ